MKRTLLFLAGTLVALVMTSGPAVAHHGGAAFDQGKTVTFDATVTQLEFANPHVLVYWTVKEGPAAGEMWSGWLTAPNKLQRAGWTKKTLAAGDHIVVGGNPHKDGNHVLQIRKLVGPDGKDLPLFEQ